MRRRHRLNPCDYLFFAHHDMMQRCGQTGNLPFMVLDTAGPLDPARLKSAVDAALAAHPALRTRARVSLLSGRPAWCEVDQLDQPAVVTHDLRNDSNWLAAADNLCQSQYALGWNQFRSPQVRLELYRGPADASRVCLRWPHSLMDAEGAQWFMHEVNRLGQSQRPPAPAALRGDDEMIDPLAGRAFGERIKLCRNPSGGGRHEQHFTLNGLADGPTDAGRWRFFHRDWSGEAWTRLRANADRVCPSGPARFSRYLGVCVLRALNRLFVEHGMSVPRWQVTLPMRLRGVPVERPLPGNYLVAVSLAATTETVADRVRLAEDLARQIQAFHDSQADLANAALVWAMQWFRLSQYRFLHRWVMRKRQPYASGFSFYGEIDPPLRELLGARVTNFWGGGTLSAPPGWNPVFSRFGDRLNLCLSWLDGYHRAATAGRYLELIDAEMLDEG